jgi:hypothetical protein
VCAAARLEELVETGPKLEGFAGTAAGLEEAAARLEAFVGTAIGCPAERSSAICGARAAEFASTAVATVEERPFRAASGAPEPGASAPVATLEPGTALAVSGGLTTRGPGNNDSSPLPNARRFSTFSLSFSGCPARFPAVAVVTISVPSFLSSWGLPSLSGRRTFAFLCLYIDIHRSSI